MRFHPGQRVKAVRSGGAILAGDFYLIKEDNGLGVTLTHNNSNFLYPYRNFIPAPILYKRQPHEPHIQNRPTSYMYR